MSDITKESIFTNRRNQDRVCRVAYTLNNEQPVICTIIGDQPLFYMDYDAESADEPMLDQAELNILENEIASLRKEIASFERLEAKSPQSTLDLVSEFIQTAEILVQTSQNKTFDKAAQEDKILCLLSKSRVAKAYIDFAHDHGVFISVTNQVCDGEYDRKHGKIFINAGLDFADQVLLTARELRRHWQHRQGALINPLMFHPDNAVLISRVQVADLAASVVRVAWELQLSGEKEIWARIEDSSYADLGRALAREAFMDFRTLNNGLAAAAVFETWFLSERCRIEDKKLIKQMLADYQGYVFEVEEAESSITPALISALGEMPFGKNYLAQHSAIIMRDPVFTEVRDRSNANFLWFIKFERSFRESEQELQTQIPGSAEGIRPEASHNAQNRDYSHEQHDAAKADVKIITLYADTAGTEDTDLQSGAASKQKKKSGRPLSSRKTAKRGEKQISAEIVYLRRWSGE